jgi:hypothetical protein
MNRILIWIGRLFGWRSKIKEIVPEKTIKEMGRVHKMLLEIERIDQPVNIK